MPSGRNRVKTDKFDSLNRTLYAIMPKLELWIKE